MSAGERGVAASATSKGSSKTVVIAGGGTLAYVLAKFADIIWQIILTLILLAVVWGIGSWIWGLV